jgi:hypothetical protein
MATMSERATLRYLGPGPVQLPDSAEPNLFTVESGGEVELNADAAAWLVTNDGERWTTVGTVPDGVLKGRELDEALEAAGLPTTGKVAEKRARLAEHEAAQLAEKQDPPADPPTGDGDDDDQEKDA